MEHFIWADTVRELERFGIYYIGSRTKESRIRQINRFSFRRRRYVRKMVLRLYVIMQQDANDMTKKKKMREYCERHIPILGEVINRTGNKKKIKRILKGIIKAKRNKIC